MSLKAYEDACTRAELFGQPKPDKAEFLERNKHLDVVEFEEVEIRTAEVSIFFSVCPEVINLFPVWKL